MPRVRPLTKAQRVLQQNVEADQTVREVLGRYKIRTSQSDQDVAEKLSWDRGRIVRLKKRPGDVRLSDVRTVLQTAGCTAEEWLKIGGFAQ